MKLVILSFLALFNFLTAFSQNASLYRSGLVFNSHTTNLDLRTGLNLNPQGPFTALRSGFTLSFEIKLKKEVQTFGYVFRMIVDQNTSFDLVSNLLENEFKFVLNDRFAQIAHSQSFQDKQVVVANKWIPIQISFFANMTKIVIGTKELTLRKGIGSFDNIAFYFGANKTKFFHTTEVPPIILKNVKIINNGRLIRHWILAKHRNAEVLDEVNQYEAEVQHGNWEIDQHAQWHKISTVSLHAPPQIAFDATRGRIFMVTEKQVYVYHVLEQRLDTILVVGGNPYLGIARQIVYSPKNDELISYTVQSPTFYTFSFKTKSWSGAPTIFVDSRMHHNHFLDTAHDLLHIFMGYAYHKYNAGQMSLDLHMNPSKWSSNDLRPQIYPRYLSSMGSIDKNRLLLLGGFGSKTGNQEEFPHNFYDMHQINPNTGQSVKLWELKIDTPYIVFSNSMHVDTQRNKVFALGYNNFNYKSKVSLYGVDIKSDEPQLVSYGNALPFNFLDIESYCDLYYAKSTNKLYAVIADKVGNGKEEVNIYSMAYPILTAADILQKKRESNIIYVIVAMGLGLIAMVTILLLKKRKPAGEHESFKIGEESEQPQIGVIADTSHHQITICVFNGFQLVGKNDIDSSAQFTPILKHLFLYLLFHSGTSKNGISSHELDRTFWQGMSADKAINNRNVNFRKLRLLLTSIGAIEITHKNGVWALAIHEAFKFDYQIVIALLKEMELKKTYPKNHINQIVTLVSGKLLPDVENEWIDSIKSSFTSLLIKVLLDAIKQLSIKNDTDLLLKMVEVILTQDSLEENAIMYKCNLLYRTGQKGLSKHTFDKYCAEYKLVLNTAPNVVYDDIILINL